MDLPGKRPLAAHLRASSSSSTPFESWTPSIAESPSSFYSWHNGQYLDAPLARPDYEPAPHKEVDGYELRGRSLKRGSNSRSATKDRRVRFTDCDRRRSVSEPAKRQRAASKFRGVTSAANRSLVSLSPLRTTVASQGQRSTARMSCREPSLPLMRLVSVTSSSSPEANTVGSPGNITPTPEAEQEPCEKLRTALKEALGNEPDLAKGGRKTMESPALITLRRASEANGHRPVATLYKRLSAAASVASPHPLGKMNSAPRLSSLPKNRKSVAADTATTYTDVHMCAKSDGQSNFAKIRASADGERRASTTSQVIRSRESVYEVVWEDSPSVVSTRAVTESDSHGCVSAVEPSTDPQIGSASASRRHGDHRISTKLAAWSWTGSPVSNSPDGTKWVASTLTFLPLLEDTFEVKPNVLALQAGGLLTPANSVNAAVSVTVTSASNSQKTSADTSGKSSIDGVHASYSIQPESSDCRRRSSTRSQASARARIADTSRTGRALGCSSHRRKPSATVTKRALSNLLSEDRHFEDHKDSVALAHERMFGPVPTLQQPRQLRDSIAVAKDRFRRGGPYQKQADDATLRRQSVLSPIPDASPDGKAAETMDLLAATGCSDVTCNGSPSGHVHFAIAQEGLDGECLHCLQRRSADDEREMSTDWIG